LGLAKIENNEKLWPELFNDSTRLEFNYLVDKALQIDPELSDGYLLRGNYLALNSPDEAERSYLKALEINPNNIEALNALSILYRDKKFDIIESIRLLKELEYRTSDREELYSIYANLSGCYSQIMDREMTFFYIEKCLAINDSSGREGLIPYYINIGEPEKALEEWKKLYPEPDTQFLLGVYGTLHCQAGRFKEAVKYYEQWARLIDIQGEDNWLSYVDWHRYGQALVKTGQDSLGVTLMRKQLSTFKQLSKQGVPSGYDVPGIYSFLNMPDSAFYYLEGMFKGDNLIRSGQGNFMLVDYQYDNIRNDKRFTEGFEIARAKMREIRKQLHTVDPNAPKIE